jgi:predicted Zn-dependent protease
MRRLLLVAALAGAACTTIASPTRISPYEYKYFAIDGDGDTTAITFHWPRSMLPIRIFVPDTSVLRPHVATAIQRWQDAFLYGEYRAVIVSDSNQADVIFENNLPPFLRAGVRLDAMAPQCGGATDAPDAVTHTVPLPVHSYVYTPLPLDTPGLDACYRITVTHEMGHTIGLLNHSPFSGDVMYSNPLLDGISTNDRETAETAYHVPANAVPTGRR